MYASEYGFAALPECWTLIFYGTNAYNLSYGKDWMLTSTADNLWTISRASDRNVDSFPVLANRGDMGTSNIMGYEYNVHPTFALSSNVNIINSSAANVGSKEVPMIIE